MEQWHIGIEPWIIEDGNYEDFRVGQAADFAVEFYAPKGLRPVTARARESKAVWRRESRYHIVAAVVHSKKDVLVLDFGLRAFKKHGPPHPRGSVEGEVFLGIDPYFYFEYLYLRPSMPPLIYRWRIEEILQLSAPLVEAVGPDGRPGLIWDETRLKTERVDRTDAWGTDRSPVAVSYVLGCRLIDPKPRRTRRGRGTRAFVK